MAFSFSAPVWLDAVPSTNTYMKSRAAEAMSGDVVAARNQTRGRGRMGNAWITSQSVSSQSGDIAFSFLWRGDVPHQGAGALPMACAVGVREFLHSLEIPASCKWPNDVLVGDAKICGILTESTFVPDQPLCLIVGIGVNVRRNPERDQFLGRKTAALEDFIPNPEPADLLLPKLLGRLEPRIAEWERQGVSAVVRAMRERLWGVGKTVRARTSSGAVEGVVLGIGDDAELLLDTGKGVTAVSSVSALETGWE